MLRGAGGAEQLIVDAAVGLQTIGHQVEMYTSHHDPKHCLSETRDGTPAPALSPLHVPRAGLIRDHSANGVAGTLKVTVFGDLFPKAKLLKALLSSLRALWLALRLLFGRYTFDVLIVDQVSTSIPLLRLLRNPARTGRVKVPYCRCCCYCCYYCCWLGA